MYEYVNEFEIHETNRNEYEVIFEGQLEDAETIFEANKSHFEGDKDFSIWVDDDLIEITFDFYDSEGYVEIKDSQYFVDESFEKELISSVNIIFWWLDEMARYKSFRIFDPATEIEFEGEVNLGTINDDEPSFAFYSEGGDICNWFTDLISDWTVEMELFVEAVHNDHMFLQYLYDQEEGTAVSLQGYSLDIFENQDPLKNYIHLGEIL